VPHHTPPAFPPFHSGTRKNNQPGFPPPIRIPPSLYGIRWIPLVAKDALATCDPPPLGMAPVGPLPWAFAALEWSDERLTGALAARASDPGFLEAADAQGRGGRPGGGVCRGGGRKGRGARAHTSDAVVGGPINPPTNRSLPTIPLRAINYTFQNLNNRQIWPSPSTLVPHSPSLLFRPHS